MSSKMHLSAGGAEKRGRNGVFGTQAGLISSSGSRRYAVDAQALEPRSRTATRTATGTGTAGRRGAGRSRGRTATARAEDMYVVAIIENRAKEVGLAAYNLRSFHVELRQYADTNCFVQTMTCLTIFNPVEIVLSQSSAGGPLDHAIEENGFLQDVRSSFIGRKYFNETQGTLACEKLSAEQCPNLSSSSTVPRYLALAAAGALIKYVEHIQAMSFEPGSMRISLAPNDGTVFLDVSTIEATELVRTSRGAVDGSSRTKNDSLFAVLDKTKTRPGKRFLRRTLLEPPADLNTIVGRQRAIEELSSDEEGYFALCEGLANFPDLEAVLASLLTREASFGSTFAAHPPREAPPTHTAPSVSTAEPSAKAIEQPLSEAARYFQRERHQTDNSSRLNSMPETQSEKDRRAGQEAFPRQATTMSQPSIALIRNILGVKAAMDSLSPLLAVVEKGSSAILLAIAESMRAGALADLSSEILTVIDEGAAPSKNSEHMRLQGAFAVRTGRNGHLDVARKTLSENVEDMHKLLQRLREQLDNTKLQLAMNAKRGYHITAPSKSISISQLGTEFIQMQPGGKFIRFSTNELVELNTRVNESLAEIWLLTDRELVTLQDAIWAKDTVSALHRLCDSIALLDALTSMISYCSMSQVQTVRPKLTVGGPIAVKGLFHPILAERSPTDIVPNDVFLSETSALHLITGRNNSGKSTFLRSTALISILAHTGCSVPAEFASFRILRNILTRFNTSDDITASQSHHSKEMQEIGTIIHAACTSKRGIPHPSSLILVDELGRSTTPLDGFSIAYAVAERLASTPNVLTLFATHFPALGALQFATPIVQSFHLESVASPGPAKPRPTEPANLGTSQGDGAEGAQNLSKRDPPNGENSRAFTYKVIKGALEDETYGIDAAQSAGFPDRVLQEAQRLRDKLPARSLKSAEDFKTAYMADQSTLYTRHRNVVHIAQQLSNLRGSAGEIGEDALRTQLKALKAKIQVAGARTQAKSDAT